MSGTGTGRLLLWPTESVGKRGRPSLVLPRARTVAWAARRARILQGWASAVECENAEELWRLVKCSWVSMSRATAWRLRRGRPATAGKLAMTRLASARWSHAVDREWPQPELAVPEHPYDPVFCSWTAIHHQANHDWVLRNAAIARDLGFGTWLTDDGWFTDRAVFADYRDTSDWEPCATAEKFPDFVGHVSTVKALGLATCCGLGRLWSARQVNPGGVTPTCWESQMHGLHFANLSPLHTQTSDVVGALLERLMRDYVSMDSRSTSSTRSGPRACQPRTPAMAVSDEASTKTLTRTCRARWRHGATRICTARRMCPSISTELLAGHNAPPAHARPRSSFRPGAVASGRYRRERRRPPDQRHLQRANCVGGARSLSANTS